jgi:hypothetical protein
LFTLEIKFLFKFVHYFTSQLLLLVSKFVCFKGLYNNYIKAWFRDLRVHYDVISVTSLCVRL